MLFGLLVVDFDLAMTRDAAVFSRAPGVCTRVRIDDFTGTITIVEFLMCVWLASFRFGEWIFRIHNRYVRDFGLDPFQVPSVMRGVVICAGRADSVEPPLILVH